LNLEGIKARTQIRDLGVGLRPPALEIILRRTKIVNGSIDLVDTAVPFIDSLGLFVELANDEGELIFDLHGDLEDDAVVKHQSFD
jgi:hypothetical protein